MFNVHVYPTTFEFETRILKITNSLLERKLVSRILIVGKAAHGLPATERIDEHRAVIRVGPILGGKLSLNKLLRFLLWSLIVFWRLRRDRVGMVNCHSLSALPLCVALKLWHQAILIYEPHELATQTITFSPGLRQWLAKWLERHLIGYAACTYVVSDSISRHYRHDYGLEDVPVVMNVPVAVSGDDPSPNRILKDHFSIPDSHLVFMYQGVLAEERGVTDLLDAFKLLSSDKHIVFMGYGPLKDTVYEISRHHSNIHLYPAVAPSDVLHYTRGADIGIALLDGDCENHRCALPNKFFHYLHAGLPVIVSDLPEMASLVDRYVCGWKVENSPESIANCIENIQPRDIGIARAGSLRARKDLHWGNEADRLERIYRNLFRVEHVPAAHSDKPYQVCNRCVMDTTVPDIEFADDGTCNYCRAASERICREQFGDQRRAGRIEQIIAEIKRNGAGKPYDCVIGVSGGVDSSYAAYLAKCKYGLRPLAIHFDNGWNSELAVQNIEQLLNRLDIDLYTHVVDWDEFRDLQLSFLKASVANCEIPTDHAILALLYQMAVKLGVRYIISGGNLSTESIMPDIWMHDAKDLRFLKSIHKRFGTVKLKTMPRMSYFALAWNILVRRIRYVGILNFVDFNKKEAIEFLESQYGWRKYEAKHFESIYTRFFQGYLLPRKFSIDKRRAHFSSLIVSGQMSRESALNELEKQPYNSTLAANDVEYICEKFGLGSEEFDAIMQLPIKTSDDYPNGEYWLRVAAPIVLWVKNVATGRQQT